MDSEIFYRNMYRGIQNQANQALRDFVTNDFHTKYNIDVDDFPLYNPQNHPIFSQQLAAVENGQRRQTINKKFLT